MVVTREVNAPDRMDHHERMRLRTAAFRAKTVYPGPVGELLAMELITWEDFGYRLGSRQLIGRLVDDIMRPRLPKE